MDTDTHLHFVERCLNAFSTDVDSIKGAIGYYGSNGASHFGQMVPVITVQMMPFWFDIDGWHYGSNGASIDLY